MPASIPNYLTVGEVRRHRAFVSRNALQQFEDIMILEEALKAAEVCRPCRAATKRLLAFDLAFNPVFDDNDARTWNALRPSGTDLNAQQHKNWLELAKRPDFPMLPCPPHKAHQMHIWFAYAGEFTVQDLADDRDITGFVFDHIQRLTDCFRPPMLTKVMGAYNWRERGSNLGTTTPPRVLDYMLSFRNAQSVAFFDYRDDRPRRLGPSRPCRCKGYNTNWHAVADSPYVYHTLRTPVRESYYREKLHAIEYVKSHLAEEIRIILELNPVPPLEHDVAEDPITSLFHHWDSPDVQAELRKLICEKCPASYLSRSTFIGLAIVSGLALSYFLLGPERK
jgi:hypothetical protein